MLLRRNYIIATAGHVDHGKTSLIKALTGKDCDTHPEEKKRGITIHLGFSHIKLTNDVYAGIVDVPGHKDFIDNMISGINGIDIVLFIIAANEGFMPQTNEHLQILNMLGVKKGLIVLTKCDLIDNDHYQIIVDEIRQKVKNTFLEHAPIVGTSIKSSYNHASSSNVLNDLNKSSYENIDKIIPLILETLNSSDETLTISHRSPYFRYYPDRFFHVKGFGSVLTGTVISGEIDKSTILYTVPSDKGFKIRKFEAYNQETQIISQGQRASINLPNFDKDDYQKGMMLCSEPYSLTVLIDVEITLFNELPHLQQWSTVEFYTATIQTQAKIHFIDKDILFAGEKCFAQLHLNKAIAVCFCDKFIVRNSSGISTLGGGIILDAFPLHHKRRTEKVKELFKLRASGKTSEIICSEIEKSVKPISLEQISKKLYLNLNLSEIGELPEKYIQFKNWFWHKNQQDRLEMKVVKHLQTAHKQNPLENIGKNPEEFIALVQDFPENAKIIAINNILDLLIKKGIIEKRKGTFALASHKIKLDTKDHEQIYWVDMFILNQKMHVPLWLELKEKGAKRDINEKRLRQILFYLTSKKRIIQHEGEYLHSLVINPIRKKLLEYLSIHPEGIAISQFRDLTNGNRKICVLLLNIFDNEGIIIRIGDNRFITEKGRNIIGVSSYNNDG